ncbi:MAG: M24 family metallopeptidase [Gemmatimonadota bacterium]|nr:MAG: M24 family metallopeptidase [Gemmatimonadota bacterium]
MTTLQNFDFDALGRTLKQRGLDGWLVYDFHDSNPVAQRMLGDTGMLTRRLFLWLPAVGPAQLVVSTIDRPAVGDFPGEFVTYTTWQELHQHLASVVGGRRVAMETSPENAVPYLDKVPSGVVELLKRLGATVLPSAPLVTEFASRWSQAELQDHRRTAEAIAEIARGTLRLAIQHVGTATEVAVQRSVLEQLAGAGLETDDPPIVAFGPHAADPHYSPHESTNRTLAADEVVLLDLWARPSPKTVWADQTWMAFTGSPPGDVVTVWETVRNARDAVVDRLRKGPRSGEKLTGAMLDNVSREVINAAGYGHAFTHRTGHSIDLDLHGSGPHLDDFETHDVRELFEGVAFSVEPGIYLPGRFGVRSEINVVLGANGPEVTPAEPQTELIV